MAELCPWQETQGRMGFMAHLPIPQGASVIAALWARLQGWLLMLGAAALVLAGAYAAGGRAARQSAELDQRRRDVAAKEKAREAAAEIDRLDDDAVRDRAERWVRGPSR